MAVIGPMKYLTIGSDTYEIDSGGGTVTSIGISNASNGGLSISGSPVTSSGSITVGHSNVLSSAQTTQAVYPIKIDKNGHISEYGSAVTIPDVSNKVDKSSSHTISSTTINSSIDYSTYLEGSSEVDYGLVLTSDNSSYYSKLQVNSLKGIELRSASADESAWSSIWMDPGSILINSSASFVDIQGVKTPLVSSGAANKQYVDDKRKAWYGTCSTTASTAAKVVTCSGYVLDKGSIIGVLFSTANTAATPTLNVNSTTAKSIYVGSSTPNATTNVLKWSANTMVYFMYDGSYYRYITSIAAGSVVQPRGANTWYGTSDTTASTAAKTSTIDNFVLTQGAIVSVAFSTANTYVAGALTLNINSTGAKTIYYNNAATSSTNTLLWSANEILTFIYSGSYYYFIGKSTILSSAASNTTGISIANHGTGTVTGVQSTTTTASKVTVGSSSTDYGVTAVGSGSGSLTFTMDTTDTKKLKITFSHTHTAPTLGSKVPTVSASDVTVPIKNTSASTFVTGTTHTITDNGHTHTLS